MPVIKKRMWLLSALVMSASFLAMAQDRSPAAPSTQSLDEQTQKFLIEALQDEREAIARYRAILDRHGDVAPFSHVAGSESHHEAHLLGLFHEYRIPVPENVWAGKEILIPVTLQEACLEAVKWEQENAAMYDRFLDTVKEPDVRAVFTRLGDMSRERHENAFAACAEGGQGGMGKGMGRGHGAMGGGMGKGKGHGGGGGKGCGCCQGCGEGGCGGGNAAAGPKEGHGGHGGH